jgi:hypothetical protein
MGPNLGQSQLGDLAQEGFEAAVFGDPVLNLVQEVLGDVDGAGFAPLFAGEVVGGMALSLLAMAAGTTASFVNEDEAGSQGGAAGLELLGAGLEVARDEGGVLGDFHAEREPVLGLAFRISILTYPKRQGQSEVRRKILEGGPREE